MDTGSPVPQTAIAADIASCLLRVSNMNRSLKFYCDVFDCRVLISESDMALLSTPNGFQLYLQADSGFRHRGAGRIGVQYLMWATDSESDLEQIAQRLRGSPRRLPREMIAKRLHG